MAWREAHELAVEKAHEQAVAAFLASVPKRRRERVLAKHAVLEGSRLRRMLENEACWEGDVVDELLATGDSTC